MARGSGSDGIAVTSTSVAVTLFDPATDGPAKGLKFKVRSGGPVLVAAQSVTYGTSVVAGATAQYGRFESGDGYQSITGVNTEGGSGLGTVTALLATGGSSAVVDIMVDIGG